MNSINLTLNKMGNILESEASEEEFVDENKNIGGEKRTEGDGMDSSLLDNDMKAQTSQSHLVTGNPLISALLPVTEIFVNKPKVPTIESPKVLPSKDQLIQLKPPKLEPGENRNSKGVVKQRDPKFVPYEPYAACTSNYTAKSKDANKKTFEESLASSTSFPVLIEKKPHSLISSGSSSSIKNLSPIHFEEQSHSTTLLKERLKMANKDIDELQVENNRLKKLLVDSLSGTAPHILAEEMKCVSLNIKNSGEMKSNPHAISESFDNLNDEIEVWRSKFLSSCILVEKLHKDNEQHKEEQRIAAEIFREIKNTTDLTPELYEKINKWLNSTQSTYSRMFSNNDLEEEEAEYQDHGGSL